MNCLFCKLVLKEIPTEILFENEKAISILDINPIHFGHALVIPKRHSVNFLDSNSDDFKGIFEVAQIVAKGLSKLLNLQGFNFVSNNGEIAGQSIFHFHIHIIPRYADDNLRFSQNLKKYEGDKLIEYANKIRESIKNLN